MAGRGVVSVSVMLVLMLVLSVSPCPPQITCQDQIRLAIHRFLDKIDVNWMFVISSNMSKYLHTFSAFPGYLRLLLLTESEFSFGSNSWTTDFEDLGVTWEHARAYFRLLNVYRGGKGFTKLLTIEDLDEIIIFAEKYTNSLGHGYISKREFRVTFEEAVFRGLPFAVLFIRAEYKWGVQPRFRESSLGIFNFYSIFRHVDQNGDGHIDEKELGEFWEKEFLGPAQTGHDLYRKLDYGHVGYLNESDWLALYDDLDCGKPFDDELICENRPADDDDINCDAGPRPRALTFWEFMQLDLIVHDLRPYPGNGSCILTLMGLEKHKVIHEEDLLSAWGGG